MAERVDLVDEAGLVRMRNVLRDDVDAQPHCYPGLYMQIVIVIALDSMQRVLVHRRGSSKEVDPEKYDHICGGVLTGEAPPDAAVREGLEETGVRLRNLRKVHEGVNEYGRWRHLYLAEADGEPIIAAGEEVSWVGYEHPDDLRSKHGAGEGFVKGFFADFELALAHSEATT